MTTTLTQMTAAVNVLYRNVKESNPMKLLLVLVLVLTSSVLQGQTDPHEAKFYLGLSYGVSFAVGDFADTEFSNPDAGFAKDGKKIELFLGVPVDEKLKLLSVIRYQNFETDIDALVNEVTEANPGVEFTGTTEDWETFAVLVGLAYQIRLGTKFSLSPRFGLGPMFVKNPGFTVRDITGANVESIERSSETGVGLGYEFGFGLRKDIGKHLALMPSFTLSGGFVTITDIVTKTTNAEVTADYTPTVLSFNTGLSIAYIFN